MVNNLKNKNKKKHLRYYFQENFSTRKKIWSILPLFSKVFEKLMYNRLFDFIEVNNILYKNQCGFQRGKSTEHAVLDLYANILQAMESKEKTSCIILDFPKAFDTLNHEILLGTLGHYGIRGLPLIWFKSYLSNRKQAVKTGPCISNFKTITCGVLQVSI